MDVVGLALVIRLRLTILSVSIGNVLAEVSPKGEERWESATAIWNYNLLNVKCNL